ncbi:hypothetical protein RN001_015200 [Aquatica leii]|uniref:Peptidase S1 domain-containing protein n=1 Tax=Aquatica leii TaxID=1421715 RepID=A0AAN7P316_9COLE|nr:hypothetical protein RN001_015200 [Aquatica leii]
MKFLLIVAIAICGFAHTNGRTLFEDKVLGGTLASPGQFPHQVSQRVNQVHYCGGSILDKNTILTAAHCVDGKDYTTINIVVGSNQLNEGGMWYSVSQYIMHLEWNPYTFVNDIAVFKVTVPIEFTKYVQPITLEHNFVPDDLECTLSGWGITSYPGSTPPNDLLYFTGKVVNLNQCRESMPPTNLLVLNSHICAYASKGIGVCSGDSGGALVANNKQIGITSWVVYCATGVPDVYTKVSHYSAWIEEQQAQTNQCV